MTCCASSRREDRPAPGRGAPRGRRRPGPRAIGRATLEDLYRQIQAGQTKELRIILKADVQGSLGAIAHALDQLQTRRGQASTSCARAPATSPTTTSCSPRRRMPSWSASTPSSTATARRTAEAEGVEVRLYDIIYRLTEDMDAALKGMLEPEEREVVEGRAEVRQIFRVGQEQVIAGSYVTDGRLVRGGARVYRNGKLVTTDRVESAAPLPGRRARGRHRATSAASVWPATPTSRKATSSRASPADRVPRRELGGPGMSQRTERLDRAAARGDQRHHRARHRRPPRRLRDRDQGGRATGAEPRQRVGLGHR